MDYDQLAFHYTGASALLSIVRNRVLWATDVEHVNDRYEGKHVNRRIESITLPSPHPILGDAANAPSKWLDTIQHSLRTGRTTAMSSFSRHFASLPQFRMYGPAAGGYVIGFPREYLKRIGNLVECDYSDDNLLGWCKSYINLFLEEAAKRDKPEWSALELSNAIVQNTDLVQQRVEAGLRFKSNEFVNESEVRLCWGSVPDSSFLYRASRDDNFVIPYIEVELPNDPVDVLVASGPNRDQALATATVANIMRAARKAGTKWNVHMGPWGYGFRC